jgi:hypothetical protein
VKKNGGSDNGDLYAMKIIDVDRVMSMNDNAHYAAESQAHIRCCDFPFLLGLHYEFKMLMKFGFVLGD